MEHQRLKKKISRTSRWTLAQSVDMRKDYLDKKRLKQDDNDSDYEYKVKTQRKSPNQSSKQNFDQKAELKKEIKQMEKQLETLKSNGPQGKSLQFTTPNDHQNLNKNASQQSVYISNNADDADNDEVIVKGRMSHSEFVDMLQTYRNSTKGLHDGQMSSSRPKIKVEKVNRISTKSV